MEIVVAREKYVGLVIRICLAEIEHSLTCIDIDENKVEKME